MKATCWMGKQNVEVREVPEPEGAHRRADGRRVLIDVHAVGLSFIDPLRNPCRSSVT